MSAPQSTKDKHDEVRAGRGRPRKNPAYAGEAIAMRVSPAAAAAVRADPDGARAAIEQWAQSLSYDKNQGEKNEQTN